MFVMYEHVLHRLREHLNVPGSSSVDKDFGLNFVPLQKKSDEFSAKFDTEQFFQRVQLKIFFS